MRTITIPKFVEWYFSEPILNELFQADLKDYLNAYGLFSVSVEALFNQCPYVPIELTEEYIGTIDEGILIPNTEVQLIN